MHSRRHLLEIIKKSKKSILLLGPRQTGKSSLIRELKPELEINLADQEAFVEHLRDPGLIKNLCENKKTVFIDEVQRIPSLLNTVQYILDSNKDKIRFFLTGSSARKLKRGKANLLPGRVHSYELGPLCASELNYKIDLKTALIRGLLPGIYLDTSDDWTKTLRTYSITYLKEEIQAEALTRDLEGFSRFFEVIASRAGDYVDFTKIAQGAHIQRMTATRYFDVLVDTLIAHRIESFSKSRKRRLIQHPKFYFFDAGVLNGVLGNFTASPDRIGQLFEHMMLQQILSSAKAMDREVRVSTYRTEYDTEVDFILEFKQSVIALELKASRTVGSHDMRGMKSFSDFYKKNHIPIIAYLGEHAKKTDGIEILPWQQALQKIDELMP